MSTKPVLKEWKSGEHEDAWFEVWDVETGNLISDFPSYSQAYDCRAQYDDPDLVILMLWDFGDKCEVVG